MNKFIKFPLVLAIVGVICAGSLSVVYEITKEKIAYNKNKEAFDLLGGIITDMTGVEEVLSDYDSSKVEKAGIKNMYEVSGNSGVTAYGYLAEVNGYNPGINFLLVLSANESKILGFEVVSHSETNSGTYGGPLLNSPEFAAQFTNISFDDVATEVDFVAGSTAKVTMSAVKTGVDNVISFHKQEIFGEVDDGINLTGTERKMLELSEGYVMTDISEDFKNNLKANVSNNFYNKLINVEVAEKTQYMKIWNYIEIKDAAGNIKGHAYVAEGQYNCEVEHGNRAWQKHKFVVMFDENGGNIKVVVVNSSDSLGAIGKGNLLNEWIEENFNGKTMSQLNQDLASQKVDKIAGASYTTSYFLNDITTVVDAHSRAYGN